MIFRESVEWLIVFLVYQCRWTEGGVQIYIYIYICTSAQVADGYLLLTKYQALPMLSLEF